ncbi:MAG: hypothetical protein KJ607_09825, partial [Bacteroidetes bacterium]|nr:hypothetical protein [Bacteroidota bacterium]
MKGLIKQRMLPVFICVLLFTVSCDKEDEPEEYQPGLYPNMLVITEDALYNGLKDKLAVYQNDNKLNDTVFPFILRWNTGTVEALRDTLKDYYNKHLISGALLVGDLPAAWYEMDGFSENEQFPCDMFLTDPLATWSDADQDGIYDYHSTLELKLYIGRIDGSESELKAYFDKIHTYRTGGAGLPAEAYLFLDDDWQEMYQTEHFNTDEIYDDLDICIDLNESTKTAYLNKLTSAGAEYVHQMIHSYPASLVFYHLGDPEYLTTDEVRDYNLKAHFCNM